jgi:ABC-type transporter Mla subunit MlaD
MSQPTTPAPAEKPKTLFERIVTSTPIILTVVATILAGLSSGEMTRAQYYRALAAQNQSKVSDQWNFFQAKRIRGTDLDDTATLLRSLSGAGKLSPESLQAAAARLSDQLDRADREGEALVKAVDAAGSAADGLRTPAERFRAAAKAAQPARGKLAEALARPEARQPLAHLTAGTVPERVEHTPDERKALDAALDGIDAKARESLNYFDPDLLRSLNELNPAIPQALWEVNERKTERGMEQTLRRITPEQIHKAIDDGEETARKFEDVGKPVSKAYRDLDRLVADQSASARALSRASQDVSLAASALPAGDAKLNDVRAASAAVGRTGSTLRSEADELANDFKAAQLVYDSRRYEREARYNQAVAGLYELDVRKASLNSERHRNRSMFFFFAMLAAQGGVTIATFAIAMRRRSLPWALATLAGLVALAVGVYVYLVM